MSGSDNGPGLRHDLFGFDHAAAAGIRFVGQAGRRSGRTQRMLNAVKAGDLIVCATAREAELLRVMISERGLRDVRVIEHDPRRSLWDAEAMRGNRRRVHVDHGWVEQRMLADAERMATSLREELWAVEGRPAAEPPGLRGFNPPVVIVDEHHLAAFAAPAAGLADRGRFDD